MAKRKPSKPHDGVLAVPVKYDPDKSASDNAAEWQKITAPKMGALCERYAIDRDDPHKWFKLALKLAIEYEPNFAPVFPKAQQGRRPSTQQALLDTILLYEMASVARDGSSVNNKVQSLTRTHPKFKGKNPGTLRERYYKLVNPTTQEHKHLVALLISALDVQENKVAG